MLGSVDHQRLIRATIPSVHTTTPMNATAPQFDSEIAPALRDFMCNNHTDLNDAVDWVCEVFDVNATDELIDQIAEEFDSFFGN